MTIYTSSEAAHVLNIGARQLRHLSVKLGVGTRHGTIWIYTPADIAILQERRTTPGPVPSRG